MRYRQDDDFLGGNFVIDDVGELPQQELADVASGLNQLCPSMAQWMRLDFGNRPFLLLDKRLGS